MSSGLAKRVPLHSADFRFLNVFGHKIRGLQDMIDTALGVFDLTPSVHENNTESGSAERFKNNDHYSPVSRLETRRLFQV